MFTKNIESLLKDDQEIEEMWNVLKHEVVKCMDAFLRLNVIKIKSVHHFGWMTKYLKRLRKNSNFSKDIYWRKMGKIIVNMQKCEMRAKI